MDIPNWAKKHLTNEDVQRIEQAIKTAETKTSGEIVPVIVRRSSTIGHVPLILMSLFVAIYMLVDGPGWQYENLGAHWAWYFVDTAALLALSTLLARMPLFQRILTSRYDQLAQVDMRAELEYYGSNISHTKDATGMLLFVSLMEHRAIVLADHSIDERVDSEVWEEVCDLLVQGMKKGDIERGFVAAIERCGEILTAEFPIGDDDTNELYDTLTIKE